jgi:hypothetical protein
MNMLYSVLCMEIYKLDNMKGSMENEVYTMSSF